MLSRLEALTHAPGARDVYVLVRTQLTPGPSGGTMAQTQVQAFGRSNESSGGVACSSNGALETAIADRLRNLAGAK